MAERVLFSETLEQKLQLVPLAIVDDSPGAALATPAAPGRPLELRMRSGKERIDFPHGARLEQDRERGVLLHFLANHELLAAELMALVLLKFPDAPKAYRAGVYEAMREEQSHALMYLRRMKEVGVQLGDYPVNDYFWRIVAPMETPLDFVTRLNLTFEQANLDFSKYYAGLFRQVGDAATAAVLEKIHLDEIGHVGHGLRWFRQWKAQGETDWHGYQRCLSFPLTPARAKGNAPFNAASRRLAGMDEEFIRALQVCSFSRGRTPVLHWFNPNAEGHARAAWAGKPWQPNANAVSLEQDLELLMLGQCKRDDALLLRRMPSIEHLERLQNAGFVLPELWPQDCPPGRKLGGVRPWAWSPEAIAQLRPYAADVSSALPMPPSKAWPHAWFSKAIGLQLEKRLGSQDQTATWCTTLDDVLIHVRKWLENGQALLKAPFACAGKGHLRVNSETDLKKMSAWVVNTLRDHGGVVVEPWLERVMDFSALYEMHASNSQRRVELIGMTRMHNDAAGRFQGIQVSRKWGSILDDSIAAFLFREAKVLDVYEKQIPSMLNSLLPGYQGAVGVDAMVHRLDDGSLALKRVIEVNVRQTMGRIAWDWMQHRAGMQNGFLRILRKKDLGKNQIYQLDSESGIFLNDPAHADAFLAHMEFSAGQGRVTCVESSQREKQDCRF